MRYDKDDRFGQMAQELQDQVQADEEMDFSKAVVREYMDPQNVGRMNDPDGFAEVLGPCGDTMEFYIQVRNGIAENVLFYTDGCGPTIACGSMLTKMAKGKSIGELELIGSEDLEKALGGLPEAHTHCAGLAVHTMIRALRNYQSRTAPSTGEGQG